MLPRLASRAAARSGVVATVVLAAQLLSAGCGESTTRESKPRQPTGEAGEGGVCEGCAEAGASGNGAAGSPVGGAATNAGAGGEAASEAGAGGAPVPAPTLLLRELGITQTVELPLMLEQRAVAAAERNAPLIAGKRALVRGYFELEPGFEPRALLGVLDVKDGLRTRAVLSELTPSQSSTKESLGSSFVFEVPASELSATASYRVRVLEADRTLLTQFPSSGYVELEAQVLAPFELVLVPLTINGFAPKAGEGELSTLRQRLLALLPSAQVELSVGEPLTIPYLVNADGDGWDEALDDLLAHRTQLSPKPNVFFYGLMAPATSYTSYCAGSCTLGLSYVSDADAVSERGSIGISVFQDGSGAKDAWDTLAHELGHAFGREHADCGNPDGPDPRYPYKNGSLGEAYGYDFELAKLLRPKVYRDVMSYCTPVWISDYTYSAVFERLAYIESEGFRALSWSPPESLRVARVDRHGFSRWRGERTGRLGASLLAFDVLDSAGQRVGVVQGRVARLDHLPGASVWFSSPALAQSGANAVDLRPVGGAVLPL
jgi:hypothetical protein